MLANAQTDMEANLKKMQLAKRITLTKTNNDKAAALQKKNTDLGCVFIPPQVSVDMIQGKDPATITTKVGNTST